MRHYILALLVQFLVSASVMANEIPTPKEQTHFVFVTIANSVFTELCGRILEEAYASLGYTITIKFVPGNRSSYMSSNGEFDGDVARVEPVGRLYKDLVMVDVPFVDLETYLFARKPELINRDLATLRLGMLRGVVYNERITSGLDPVYAKNAPQLLNLLMLERVDAVILSGFSGDLEIARNYPDGEFIKKLPALYSIPMYHYLHRNHVALVPKIAAALRQMLESGRIGEIKSDVQRSKLLSPPHSPSPSHTRSSQ